MGDDLSVAGDASGVDVIISGRRVRRIPIATVVGQEDRPPAAPGRRQWHRISEATFFKTLLLSTVSIYSQITFLLRFPEFLQYGELSAYVSMEPGSLNKDGRLVGKAAFVLKNSNKGTF